MPDAFAALAAPASKAASVTLSDGTDLATPTRGFYVGGAGNISLILANDTTAVTLTGVLAGQVYPLRVKRFRFSGTTATNIVALW